MIKNSLNKNKILRRYADIGMVRIQKSAEAIVAKCQGQCLGHGEGQNIKESKGS